MMEVEVVLGEFRDAQCGHCPDTGVTSQHDRRF
jgi:hypothetical protein